MFKKHILSLFRPKSFMPFAAFIQFLEKRIFLAQFSAIEDFGKLGLYLTQGVIWAALGLTVISLVDYLVKNWKVMGDGMK